jgi:PAS domain S-box-containing protein
MTDPKLNADRFWSLRDRAEQRLREAGGQPLPQATDQRLHRIELELQNEDLLRANRQLETLRDSYRKLFDFAPLGYCLLDPDGVILDANLEAARLLGVGRSLLPGTPGFTYLAPECRQAFVQYRTRVFELGVPGRSELRLTPRDAEDRLVEMFFMALDDPGALSRRCLIALTAITERRRAEEHSRYLASIVEFSRDAIVGVDLAGRIVSWNAGAERIYGFPAREMLGRPVRDLAPSGRTEELARLTEAMLQGRSITHFETKRLRKDGVLVDVSLNISPIRDPDGTIVGLSTIARDVTSRKRLRRELVAAKREAVAASQAKSEFLANMSHEIRNPINAVLGLTRLVLADEGLPAKQVQRLAMVLEASESLLGIVGDVLDYSKIEAGKLELEERPFDLRRLVASVMDEQRPVAEHKGLALCQGVGGSVPGQLIGDAPRLRQILVNLVGNALKFTDAGRVEVLVEPAPTAGDAAADDVRLLFSVADTGIGLAPEQLTRIFDSFVQVDSGLTKRYAGSGLGLAICRKLVRLMAGEIWAESEPGRGSIFRFTAVFGPVAGREPAESGGMPATRAGGELPPLAVLVAEDNRINQLFTEDLLASRGHAVTVVGNGREVLDRLSREHYDLVLMDVQMPILDGLAATRAIREHDGSLFDPDIPVLGLSAYASKGDRERFMAAGMDDYLAKPIRFEDFFRAMRRLLEWRAADDPEGGEYDPDRSRIALGVSPDVFGRMAALFVADTPEHLAGLAAALAAGDRPGARTVVHGLAGSLGAVRARTALELAARLETALAEGTMDAAASLFPCLKAELDRVARSLEDFVAGETAGLPRDP